MKKDFLYLLTGIGIIPFSLIAISVFPSALVGLIAICLYFIIWAFFVLRYILK